ncbi:hypothetical protein TRE132_12160 [Pseudomonas chlororaphis subsp. aurantiaca]|nr:hypothetical protein TRE132_12160 [Pseudomonas chlororaphis subsp. aurantiaca]
MQLPAFMGICVKTWQVRHREQFFASIQQRQSATDEGRQTRLVEQALEVAVTAPRQLHHLAPLTVTHLQGPLRRATDELQLPIAW